jgi:uncharacterized protein YkwD
MPVPEAVRLQRRKRLRGLLVVALALGVIALWDHLDGSSAESHGLNLRFRPNAIELVLLDRVNAARHRAGQPPVAFSAPLMRAAYFHSSDMAASGYLAFDSPLGDTPADRIASAGLAYRELAENIFSAGRESLSRLADNAIAHWLADPEDRANLLSASLRTTGIGVARADDGSFYITQDMLR